MEELIEIKEGHDSLSYFWIMPVKVKDMTKDADDSDNVDEYRKLEISIEEENIRAFLFPLLLKYFDDNLPDDKHERIKLTENYKDVIINFYNRFIKYMENMIKEGKEKGYTLISFMGP